jgi:hypothetical protein
MRKRKNLIKLLLRLGGQLIEDRDELKLMTSNLYKSLYTPEGVQDMNKGLDHVPCKVMIVMNESLTFPFVQEEVKTTLFQMFPTRVANPDGFTTHFCGEDLTKVVLDIMQDNESVEIINDTILVFIPTVKNPSLFCNLNL